LPSLPFLVLATIAISYFGYSLNLYLLGEQEAKHLGINVQKLKWIIIAFVALGTGTSVALCGMIGFVGLVVPHLLRLMIGPDNRLLLPASALLGGILLLLADLIARTVVSPTELPIGLVTSLLGSPFFLYLLMRQKRNKRI
jgi:iron complex transport system permease protein